MALIITLFFFFFLGGGGGYCLVEALHLCHCVVRVSAHAFGIC